MSGRAGTLAVVLGLTLLAALAAAYVFSNGWTLYYGDAEAHLNIARRMADSRTPGYSQVGTVWLPLPHLMMLPFAANNSLWHSGLAGVFSSVFCFVVAGTLLFSVARMVFDSVGPALVCLAIFALNPNVLYLSSIPMTEPVFFAALFGMLWAMVKFRDNASLRWAATGGVAALAASLTRYEGWFLIPFAALFFLLAGARRGFSSALVFGMIASLGPLWWIAHNYYQYGNALEFYNGPDSAMAIYQRSLDAGVERYRGDHDWLLALRYHGAAVLAVSGAGAVIVAGAGVLLAAWRRQQGVRLGLPVLFLALPPLFYIWSMHSSGTPIYVPTLWPFSYYNTRYGLAAFPLLAYCAGILVLKTPPQYRKLVGTVVILIAVSPWLLHLSQRQEMSICWRESRANSESRRAWTHKAAQVLASSYQTGEGILCPFGDLIAVLREAGIDQKEALHPDNHPAWDAAIANPRLFLHEDWVIAVDGDVASKALKKGPRYRRVATFTSKDAPPVGIYRRN